MNLLPRLLAGVALLGVAALAVFAVMGADDPAQGTEVALTTSSINERPDAVDAQRDTGEDHLGEATAPVEAAVSSAEQSAEVDADVEQSADAAPASVTPPREQAPRRFNGPKLNEAPPVLGAEGELRNLDGWLQSDIESLDDLDGKVHIVQFWTFGCVNCKNTLDNMSRVYDIYGGDDFEIVGVHAPEFEREKDPVAILEAAERLNVTWPIALDTEKTNFRSWQETRRFWPRTYVVDQNGTIRLDRIGEGAYEKIEATVAWLLEEGPGDAAATFDS